MKRLAILALLALGLLQMTADLVGLPRLAGAAAATGASPAPRVFSSVRGLETFSTRYRLVFKDTEGEMRRISAYLDIPVDEEIWQSLVEGVSFKSMKSNAELMAPGSTHGLWKDTSNFFHKGTSKRWQGFLTDQQVAAYDDLARRELGEELAQWLEFGGRID